MGISTGDDGEWMNGMRWKWRTRKQGSGSKRKWNRNRKWERNILQPNMSINVEMLGELPFEIFEHMRIAMNHYPLLPGVGEMADEKQSTVVSEPSEVF